MTIPQRPANLQASMTPKVSWKAVAPADVLGALSTLGPLTCEGRSITYKGTDVESLLAWTFAELDLAEGATVETDRQRHASQVVIHAKKALDCLFDAYIERDFLGVQLPPRAQFSKKLELLKKRLGLRLPWRLIPAIVAQPRDSSEHERVPPSVRDAGVAAEAAKVTIEAMVAASSPLHGPALVGSFGRGYSGGAWGHHVYVSSFPEAFGWIWNCEDGISRVGVGVRSSQGVVDAAEIQYAPLREFSEEQHLALLRQWDTFQVGGWMSESLVSEVVNLAGLSLPR